MSFPLSLLFALGLSLSPLQLKHNSRAFTILYSPSSRPIMHHFLIAATHTPLHHIIIQVFLSTHVGLISYFIQDSCSPFRDDYSSIYSHTWLYGIRGNTQTFIPYSVLFNLMGFIGMKVSRTMFQKHQLECVQIFGQKRYYEHSHNIKIDIQYFNQPYTYSLPGCSDEF